MLKKFKLLLCNDNVNNICTLYAYSSYDFVLWFNGYKLFNSFQII